MTIDFFIDNILSCDRNSSSNQTFVRINSLETDISVQNMIFTCSLTYRGNIRPHILWTARPSFFDIDKYIFVNDSQTDVAVSSLSVPVMLLMNTSMVTSYVELQSGGSIVNWTTSIELMLLMNTSMVT